MNGRLAHGLAGWLGIVLIGAGAPARGGVVFETTSPYHHILVLDQSGVRTLNFDSSMETRMSLANPLLGHFEYTEFFHTAWLWNTNLSRVLVLGLGGASTQRSFQFYYPYVTVETAELDPVVAQVARDYFSYREGPKQILHLEDGRVFLRRSEALYGAIFLDAYTQDRYGSVLPQHLVTKEFFTLASEHLTTDGVLAYNVITDSLRVQSRLLAAMYRTMGSVFPRVYAFPARESQNVVLVGAKAKEPLSVLKLKQRATALIQARRVVLPTFTLRVQAIRADAPVLAQQALVFTDDFAPIERLGQGAAALVAPPGPAPAERGR